MKVYVAVKQILTRPDEYIGVYKSQEEAVNALKEKYPDMEPFAHATFFPKGNAFKSGYIGLLIKEQEIED